MPNEQRDQKSKEVTQGLLQLCLYLLMTSATFQEYLARLGIDTRGPPLTLANISHGASYQTLEGGDITSMVRI